MRVYLKVRDGMHPEQEGTMSLEDNFLALVEEGVIAKKVRIKNDDFTGAPYIDLPDPTDPSSCIPDIPENMIDFVTFRQAMPCGFIQPGYYCREQGDYSIKVSGPHGEVHAPFHMVEARAVNIQELRGRLLLLRSGELGLFRAWGAKPCRAESTDDD